MAQETSGKKQEQQDCASDDSYYGVCINKHGVKTHRNCLSQAVCVLPIYGKIEVGWIIQYLQENIIRMDKSNGLQILFLYDGVPFPVICQRKH